MVLYGQIHRGRLHLYWSKDGVLADRISIGKFEAVEFFIDILYRSKSRHKKIVFEILNFYGWTNMIEFLSQTKSKVLAEMDQFEADHL